jgi:hypothetical protein
LKLKFLDSPFTLIPETMQKSQSFEMLPEIELTGYTVIEGGPLDGVQCGEKMWLVIDANIAPYFDAQFLIIGIIS